MQSITENKWIIAESPEIEKIEELSKEINLHPILTKLLLNRGVNTFEEARVFFRPSLEMLHDPFSMMDMRKAVDRIKKSMDNDEKIMLLGDYDVDGTTATSLSYNFLSSIHDDLEYYIPDRYKEGYGISVQSIEYAAENDVKLIISLDCGIKAVEKVAMAGQHDIDFIICDHHTPGEKLPEAVAILDPKRSDCQYPYDSLSGAGVAFKLMQALSMDLNIEDNRELNNLDLLATSNAADIVPITGENRILTKFGLEKINSDPSPGLKAMMEISGKTKDYKISDVVFKIAPRINSAGRMASGKKAVEILISKDYNEAINTVKEVDLLNNERKETDRMITQDALESIREDEGFSERKTTVLFNEEWHKGVIGIVASRLIERYYRPTIIFTGADGILSGSARSVKRFDLYSALEECADLLIQYGGHKYAAGMTMKQENFEKFRDKFEKVVSERIEEQHLQPQIEIDSEIALKEVDSRFYTHLRLFAPFGPGNMNPVFLSRQLVVHELRSLEDRNGSHHLKLKVFDPGQENIKFDVIAFGMGKRVDELDLGVMIDLVYNIEENHWNGRTSLQLVAKDFRMC